MGVTLPDTTTIMPKRSLATEPKNQESKIKKIAEAARGDGCAHPFNLTSLGYSTDDELIRVCNLCHHTWHELCSNNAKIVMRKETKDGPHVGVTSSALTSTRLAANSLAGLIDQRGNVQRDSNTSSLESDSEGDEKEDEETKV